MTGPTLVPGFAPAADAQPMSGPETLEAVAEFVRDLLGWAPEEHVREALVIFAGVPFWEGFVDGWRRSREDRS